MSFVSVSLGLH